MESKVSNHSEGSDNLIKINYSDIINRIYRPNLAVIVQNTYRHIKHSIPERRLELEHKVELLITFIDRFLNIPAHYNTPRFQRQREGIDFLRVIDSLFTNPEAMWSLRRLEETGGKPDLFAEDHGEYIFKDFSLYSPEGRRNMDYDECSSHAEDFGVEMEDQSGYTRLCNIGAFDSDRSDRQARTLIKAPSQMRENGGVLIGQKLIGRAAFFEYPLNYKDKDVAWRAVLRVKQV